jgi:serine/threonine protein kinase
VSTVSTTPGPAAIGADDKELAAGQEVGEYRIEGVLGRGGFGTVYNAVQPVIGKRVAIKVLARKYAADPDIVSRFAAEARAVNQIRHRNIIDIFSFGQLPDGRHYYVMEHLDGEPLDSFIRTHGAMQLDDALPILRSIARALDAAHAKGIAHRDLKPENIFLANDADGGVFPKLLDFGIAKLLAPEDSVMHRTGTGVPIGTPYYMSPEQCRGRDVDHRTDIYSFGIVTYRLLTGAFPFEGDDFVELLFKQVNEQPRPPTSINPALPASVDTAIAWMMQKDREQRPRTVLEAINALDPSASVTPTPLPRGSRPSVSRTGRGAQPNTMALAETGISSPDASNVSLAATRDASTLDTTSRAPARSRTPLVIAGVVVLLGMAATGAYIVTREDAPPAVASTVPQDAAVAAVAADAAVAVAVPADAADHPAYITVELRAAKGELPPGTVVTLAGKQMGTAPKLSLPYGTSELNLTVEAPGFLPAPLSVTPSQNQSHTVKLTKRPRGGAKPSRDDLINFPGAAE